MTPPRQILPGQLFEISARTYGRHFRFLPTAQVNQLLLYLFAVAAERSGIVFHALVVMANHYHLLGTDTRGALPEFTEYLHSLVARSLNALHGCDDKLWSGDGYTLLRPQASEDVWARLLYILGNPCAADLVEELADYPGVSTEPRSYGREIIIKRPDWFFSDSGEMPADARFCVEVPEILGLEVETFATELASRLGAQEAQQRRSRRAAGRGVLGLKRLRQLRVGAVPRSREQWFTLRPRIAAKCPAARIAALRRLRAFEQSYAVARAAWLDGALDVVFPSGSYWLPRFAGACVAPP
ncbi:MAG: putative transposase [Bradymonadia bacterium]|jgi:putative transposase